jgi:hypothetical protein
MGCARTPSAQARTFDARTVVYTREIQAAIYASAFDA